jgi:DNA-binding LytR/AlgR family response regulator
MKDLSGYNDLWLRIIGSLVLSHQVETLGRSESWAEQLVKTDYWIALVSGWVIAFLVWTITSTISSELDKRFDWLERTLQRVALQIVLGVLLPAGLVLVLTWIQMKYLFDQDMFASQFQLTEFPFIVLIILLINLLYLAWYLYLRLRLGYQQKSDLDKVKREYQNVLLVNSGNTKVPVPVNTIQIIQKQGDYSLIKTPDREYVTSATLSELEELLSPVIFFRANRQVIIHFNSCKAIRSLDYGKMEIQTDINLNEPLIVSQKRSPALREWMATR